MWCFTVRKQVLNNVRGGVKKNLLLYYFTGSKHENLYTDFYICKELKNTYFPKIGIQLKKIDLLGQKSVLWVDFSMISHISLYCILIEIRNEFFDLIGWETVRTQAYGLAYGPATH